MKNLARSLTLGLTTLLLAGPQAWAIDIGPMTAIMEHDEEFISRTVTNNASTPKLYELAAYRITSPTADEAILPMAPGELLFAPKRFVLHPDQRQHVKLYYKGPGDRQERYYRVVFTEVPVAQAGTSDNAGKRSSVEMTIALQSILVVRPRQERFEYRLDQEAGSITNTGNSFFEFMVKQGCDQPDSMADSKYLLPGETYRNPKISQSGNQKLIVHQSRFVRVGKDCWPD
ncbi:fimbria/pilus periplasmic chaperone [Aeromonas salmonicida]|uniref:fimbria/pilus periplasmic chaperone n=1 Tax=Aeromonas salmonicida TaxID=645 RepID=UPI00259F7A3C|nr:fimbria/pilus periplasmic chaperone [Aeromonas salmonicida]MDM5150751.1 fimbria/pilus periplasmic chaperone [Aeromonas salmonicida]